MSSPGVPDDADELVGAGLVPGAVRACEACRVALPVGSGSKVMGDASPAGRTKVSATAS